MKRQDAASTGHQNCGPEDISQRKENGVSTIIGNLGKKKSFYPLFSAVDSIGLVV
jgi:hypothetical protein